MCVCVCVYLHFFCSSILCKPLLWADVLNSGRAGPTQYKAHALPCPLGNCTIDICCAADGAPGSWDPTCGGLMGAKGMFQLWEERNQEQHGNEKDVAAFLSMCWELYVPTQRGVHGNRTGLGESLHFWPLWEIHDVWDPVQGYAVLEIKWSPSHGSFPLFPVSDHSMTSAQL